MLAAASETSLLISVSIAVISSAVLAATVLVLAAFAGLFAKLLFAAGSQAVKNDAMTSIDTIRRTLRILIFLSKIRDAWVVSISRRLPHPMADSRSGAWGSCLFWKFTYLYAQRLGESSISSVRKSQ